MKKGFVSKMLRLRIIKPENTATMCKIPTKILKSIVFITGDYFKTNKGKKKLPINKLVKVTNLTQYMKISLRGLMCWRLMINVRMALKLITPSVS